MEYPHLKPGMGYPHLRPGMRYPPPSRPGMGYPHLRPGMRYPPPSRPGQGTPPSSRPGWDTPPVEVWTETQSENITFPHPLDAGGKKKLSISWTISFNGAMELAACARTQSTNFISLFLHIYLNIYNISHLEVIFFAYLTQKQAYILGKINKSCKLQCYTFQVFSTNGYEVISWCQTESHSFQLNITRTDTEYHTGLCLAAPEHLFVVSGSMFTDEHMTMHSSVTVPVQWRFFPYVFFESTHITGCIQMEQMTALPRQRRLKLSTFFWKIFHFIAFEDLKINNFEGYLTRKFPYFGKYFDFLSRDYKSFVPFECKLYTFKIIFHSCHERRNTLSL